MFVPVYVALGKALSTWATVENLLGLCYAHCRGGDPKIAMADFW